MKATIRNLGIIKKEASIDLKPLTIFIGPNNTGKTWLAYALAGILGSYGSSRYIRASVEDHFTIYEPLKCAVEQVLAQGSATIDLRHLADEYGETYFNDVAKYICEWMGRYLSTKLMHFDDMAISFHLNEARSQFLHHISAYSLRREIGTGATGSLLTLSKKRGEDELYAFSTLETQNTEDEAEQIDDKIPSDEVKVQLINFVSRVLHRSLYPMVYTFPTERTTLVTLSFVEGTGKGEQRPLDDEKVREALALLTKELDIQSMPPRETIQPVGSFLDMLSRIFKIGTRESIQRERTANSNPQIRYYLQLAEVLEKQILTGNISFSTPEPEPIRELLFQPDNTVSLEMPIASSMVKELAPLALYLRYLARPGELLVIDEPEMNLHPEAQAKIIELLAMLVNAGLNVLFTTHSPYITDHLANLIKAAEYEDKEAIKDEFFLKQTEAFISKERVSVYGFSGGEVKNVLDEDGLIDWNTFGKISERISDIYFKL